MAYTTNHHNISLTTKEMQYKETRKPPFSHRPNIPQVHFVAEEAKMLTYGLE